MRVLKRILPVMVLLAVMLAAIGVLLPRHAQVERAIEIAAPPANVFTVLDNFHVFGKWSPWTGHDDPDAHTIYNETWSGVGAHLDWQRTAPEPDNGSAAIVESLPYRRIAMRLALDDRRPMAVAFTLSPTANGTRVVWHADTDFGWNLAARFLGLLPDNHLGDALARGLENLKRLVEVLPQADLGGADIRLIRMQPVSIVYVNGHTTTDGRDVANALDTAYAEVRRFVAANRLEVTGAPMALTRLWDPAHNRYEFEAALPVDWKQLAQPAGSPVKLGQTLGGRVVMARWVGPYSGTGRVYDQIAAWLAANGLVATGLYWEQYPNSPATTPDDKLVTLIYTPVKAAP
ncbi:MAG TPA: SRPBCC family protein [Gammaproteobacteria bacterium]|nr:SRPBCC family protein [Gammaproteobacteria bacterium]